MAIISLSGTCDHKAVIDALATQGLLNNPPNKIAIHFSASATLLPSAVAFLAAWGLRQRETCGTQLVVTGDEENRRYLARMDLLGVLESPFAEEVVRRPPSGRFLPVTLVHDDKSVKQAVDSVCDLVLQQFDDPRPFLPALEWAVNEVTDNIQIHAEAGTPGAVCAQYFDREKQLEVAIVDAGRGLKASLEGSMPIFSHGHAIEKAVERGVTRDTKIGMGNGLAGTLAIVAANHGGLRLWTGDVTLRIRDGEKKKFDPHAFVPGTGVCLSLATTRPVDLGKTFIGSASWTYIEAQAEKLLEAGGVQVIQECEHTGGRRPARALRRKLMTLLPDMDRPLVLDFSGVTSASSSFLDELLGRMVAELGVDKFKQQVSVQNVNPQVSAMANVVIKQRLEGLP